MNTIHAINADGQERIETIESSQVAKRIKILQNQGWLNIKVIA
jgi:hypothetical protein